MSIISRFSIFKKTEHKRFDPIPRFYNPEKEYIEDKLSKNRINDENEKKYADIKSNIRNNFRNNKAGFGTKQFRKNRGNSSNIRLVVILVLLIGMTYYLLTRYFGNIESLIN